MLARTVLQGVVGTATRNRRRHVVALLGERPRSPRRAGRREWPRGRRSSQVARHREHAAGTQTGRRGRGCRLLPRRGSRTEDAARRARSGRRSGVALASVAKSQVARGPRRPYAGDVEEAGGSPSLHSRRLAERGGAALEGRGSHPRRRRASRPRCGERPGPSLGGASGDSRREAECQVRASWVNAGPQADRQRGCPSLSGRASMLAAPMSTIGPGPEAGPKGRVATLAASSRESAHQIRQLEQGSGGVRRVGDASRAFGAPAGDGRLRWAVAFPGEHAERADAGHREDVGGSRVRRGMLALSRLPPPAPRGKIDTDGLRCAASAVRLPSTRAVPGASATELGLVRQIGTHRRQGRSYLEKATTRPRRVDRPSWREARLPLPTSWPDSPRRSLCRDPRAVTVGRESETLLWPEPHGPTSTRSLVHVPPRLPARRSRANAAVAQGGRLPRTGHTPNPILRASAPGAPRRAVDDPLGPGRLGREASSATTRATAPSNAMICKRCRLVRRSAIGAEG